MPGDCRGRLSPLRSVGEWCKAEAGVAVSWLSKCLPPFAMSAAGHCGGLEGGAGEEVEGVQEWRLGPSLQPITSPSLPWPPYDFTLPTTAPSASPASHPRPPDSPCLPAARALSSPRATLHSHISHWPCRPDKPCIIIESSSHLILATGRDLAIEIRPMSLNQLSTVIIASSCLPSIPTQGGWFRPVCAQGEAWPSDQWGACHCVCARNAWSISGQCRPTPNGFSSLLAAVTGGLGGP